MTQEQFESKQAEVSDIELIKTIETKLNKLCKTGGKSLSMSVPPQVSDIDMAICELIRRYKQLTLTDISSFENYAVITPEQNIITVEEYMKTDDYNNKLEKQINDFMTNKKEKELIKLFKKK